MPMSASFQVQCDGKFQLTKRAVRKSGGKNRNWPLESNSPTLWADQTEEATDHRSPATKIRRDVWGEMLRYKDTLIHGQRSCQPTYALCT